MMIYYLQSKEKKTWLEISSQTMIGNFQSKTDWKCIIDTQSMLDRKFPINGIGCTVKQPNHEKRKPALLKIEEVCGKIKWTSSEMPLALKKKNSLLVQSSSEIWPHCERWKAQQHSKTLVNVALLWPHKDKTLKFVV